MGFSGAAPLWRDGEARSLRLREGQTAGPQAIPGEKTGEIFTLHKASCFCLDQTFLQGWAAFLTLNIKIMRPTGYSLYHD